MGAESIPSHLSRCRPVVRGIVDLANNDASRMTEGSLENRHLAPTSWWRRHIEALQHPLGFRRSAVPHPFFALATSTHPNDTVPTSICVVPASASSAVSDRASNFVGWIVLRVKPCER